MGGHAIWRGSAPLLLASTSRARLALLTGAGIPTETQSSGLDERDAQARLGPGATPDAIAWHLAHEKALAVSRRHPGRIVVGADQVLDLDGEAIPKSETADAAIRVLLRLAGRAHRLHSAVALAEDGAVLDSFVAEAVLTMRPLDEASARFYVSLAGEAATRSAGGYEIEGMGIHLFSHVDGDHATILGLPLLRLLAILRGRHLLGL